MLKMVWKPAYADAYLESYSALHRAYLAGVDWEPVAAIEARAAQLTAAILLARVDGKSPADYLHTPKDRAFVRATSRALILEPPATMAALAAVWAEGRRTR